MWADAAEKYCVMTHLVVGGISSAEVHQRLFEMFKDNTMIESV
jgi:hypothetical protein